MQAPFAKSYTSALCLVPPRSVWDAIQSSRCFADRNFVRWISYHWKPCIALLRILGMDECLSQLNACIACIWCIVGREIALFRILGRKDKIQWMQCMLVCTYLHVSVRKSLIVTCCQICLKDFHSQDENLHYRDVYCTTSAIFEHDYMPADQQVIQQT